MPRNSVRLKRWRGQHFLTDQNMLKKIVAAANIQAEDTVVEIGAGTGNLTALLAEKAKRVIAIEIDRDLIPILIDRCAQYSNVEIVNDDARFFDPGRYSLTDGGYLIVANIPYYITSFLIRIMVSATNSRRTGRRMGSGTNSRVREIEPDPIDIELDPIFMRPSRMVLLIQKEVAQRICAAPPNMSILSVAVQYYAAPSILFYVPRACFSPRPKVDSALIEIKNGDSHLFCEEERCKQYKKGGCPHFPSAFFRVVHAGFAHKRKLLASNLAFGLHIPRDSIAAVFNTLDILPTARAQELSVVQWNHLCSSLFPFT